MIPGVTFVMPMLAVEIIPQRTLRSIIINSCCCCTVTLTPNTAKCQHYLAPRERQGDCI